VSLELKREEQGRRVCRLCGDEVERICARCGIDIETGDLVQEPASEPEGPQRDGTRPLRRRAARLLAIPRSAPQWVRRGFRESLQAWPATLVCLIVVGFLLSVQRIPFVNIILPAAGQLFASFVLTLLTIEHARGAREGHKASLETKGAFDPSVLGSSLLMALLLLPLYAGPFMGNPWVALAAGIPISLIFPAFLGALVTDSAEELSLSRLKQAVVESPHYLRTTIFSMACLLGGLAAVWLPVEEQAIWRAPLAVLGVTLAGTFSGLMRRDAETMIDEDDES